ncbi:CaiB/BaiF CoA transferase family protein [Blastococcus sp. SYSU D00669]
MDAAERSVTGPLAGVRVIDLTAALAGPFCSMLLSDMGAEVIKVEPPRGDVTRHVGPYPADAPDGLGGYFQSINRGKHSVVIDLKTDAGRAEFYDLVATADLLLENFGPGVVDRLGIGYERVHEVNPRLVYGSLTGFGSQWSGESPYIDWPAMDVTVQAMAGALSITGTEDGMPVKIGPGIGDIFPGTLLAVGVLGALRHADRTGEGQQVDIAMYDSILALCERIVYQHSFTGEVPRPIGNTHPILTPFDVLPVKDGFIAIAATTQPRWARLCEIMGRPELITDSRFADEKARAAHRQTIRQILEQWTVELTRQELSELLGGKVPFGPLNTVADIFADRHAWIREMLVEVESPGSEKSAVIAGAPIKFSVTKPPPLRRAPFLDEDGERLRVELAAGRRPASAD